MTRSTVLATVALAALAAVPGPAVAEEVVFENHVVRSRPAEGAAEKISLDVPAGWDRDRLNRYSVGFFDYTDPVRTIVVDLDPLADTARETRAERRTLRDLGRRFYREFAFQVNDPGEEIRVRWIFAYRDAQTDDTWSYTSVFLMKGERLVIDGRLVEKQELRAIRRHVVRSVELPE
jgi:hypothetical protein